jgi:hypothetical protein
MRASEVSYQREPDQKRVPAELIPPMGRGVCFEVCRHADRRGMRKGRPLLIPLKRGLRTMHTRAS